MRITVSLIIITILNSCVSISQKTEFPNQINTTKTDSHQRVKGTKVYSIVPSDYQYIKELARYQKREKLYIQIIELNGVSFYDTKSNFSRGVIEAKSVDIDFSQDIKVNGFDGIYVEGPSKYPGETKIGMIFGDTGFQVVIGGVFKNSDSEGKKELQSILQNVFYENSFKIDPLELADFEFDKSITGFKYMMTASNMFLYSENGKSDNENLKANTMSISMLPMGLVIKAEEYANDLIRRYEINGAKIENKKIEKSIIGDFPAYVLETKIELQNVNGILYQVVLVGKEKGIVFTGAAFNDFDDFLFKYKKTVESIKMK